MTESLSQFLESAGHPRFCVVGDMMLDGYVWGEVSRISQEGPIPVLRVERRELRVGGAGNVAQMLKALGAEVELVGLVGRDEAASRLRTGIEEAGIPADGLVASPARPTAAKTRYMGYVQSAGRALQQIVRVDEEDVAEISADEWELVEPVLEAALERSDFLVVQDMGKGFFSPETVAGTIGRARAAGRMVFVDPEVGQDYGPYAGASCVLPNRFEAQVATGIRLDGEARFREAAHSLLDRLSLESVVIKLDRDGIFYATRDGEQKHMTTHAQAVADITGAGDMVTAAFAFARACGADHEAAVTLANFAAGMEVARHGVIALPRELVVAELQAENDPATRKIVDRAQFVRMADEFRRQGLKIVFTNGCFDLLHLGHIKLIEFAGAQGDVLAVGLNSDVSIRKLKGPDRPVNSEGVRARILASLAAVDYVVLFDEREVLPLIKEIRPDVVVKGGDYTVEQVVGQDFVRAYGGEVKLAPKVEGFSTTDLIRKIADNHAGQG
jgi:D-beta-D-heptose 7-phosphate kinase/D-beta-D-heptose 1-phosphate adenosyltransferase